MKPYEYLNLQCACGLNHTCPRLALAARALTTCGARHGADAQYFNHLTATWRRQARWLRRHGHYLIMPPGQLNLL